MTKHRIQSFFSKFRNLKQIAVIALLVGYPNLAVSQNNLNEYSPEIQRELGREFINQLHNYYDVIQDPEINHYIRSIGHKIAQHTEPKRSFQFYIINNPDINAFAGPDGVIGIHSGLLQSVTTEDELASVLAHEIAHVTQNHLYRRLVLQSKSTLPQIAAMIAGILIGVHDSSAGIATLMGSSALQMQQQLKYSRHHEYEADHAGIKYLYESGYNPMAMPDFFEKLAKAYQNHGHSMPEILRTHPLTENRLAKAQQRARGLDPKHHITRNRTLQLIQLRLNHLLNIKVKAPEQTKWKEELTCYQKNLNALQSFNSLPESCYKKIDELATLPYLFHALRLELAKQNLENNRSDRLLNAQFSYELFPNNISILIRYANYLNAKGKRQQAITLLEQQITAFNYKKQIYQLLSRLYDANNNETGAYLYLAYEHLEIGNIQRAGIYAHKAKMSYSKEDRFLLEKIEKIEQQTAKLLKDKTNK